MSLTIQTQHLPNNLPNNLGLYDNGHFSSKIVAKTKPVSYSFLQSVIEQESFLCELEFDDFDVNFDFQIFDIKGSLESNEITFFLNLDNQIKVKAVLQGTWEKLKSDMEPSFHITNFGMSLYENLETPLSMFLNSTLWAMLGISSKFTIKFPMLNNYILTSSFEMPIDEISKLLQERQIAYRLLVIETATGIKLPFSHGFIDGKDIENIAFCYKAIIEREFSWFSTPTIIPWQSNEESLTWLPESNEPSSVTFRPEPVVKSIFGIDIPLGLMAGKIDKAVIDNYEEAKEKLAKLDNKSVSIKQRSVDGTILMIAVNVPHLPQNPWTEKLKNLINIDSQLDEKVLERYFSLASSTLDGLTEKQKEEITERPELDEEAFDF
jgi:hypothetical protein